MKAWGRPLDEPLRWWLANPRALRVNGVADFFWTRLLDIPAALEARRYRSDTELVIELQDPLFPDNSGRYSLTVADGSARCEKTSQAADLSMSVAELGAMYLGGVRASDLARAARVRELDRRGSRDGRRRLLQRPAPMERHLVLSD